MKNQRLQIYLSYLSKIQQYTLIYFLCIVSWQEIQNLHLLYNTFSFDDAERNESKKPTVM